MREFEIHDDISDLSPRHQRIARMGVRGGDENDDTPAEGDGAPAESGDAAPAEATAPAEAAAPEASTGETPAAAAPAAEAVEPTSITVPELPENIQDADEAELRTRFSELDALVREHVQSAGPAEVPALEQAHERRVAIRDELQRRRDLATAATDALERLANGEPVELPEPAPEPALASAAAVVAGRDAQPAAQQAPPTPAISRPRAAIVAGAGANVNQPGTEIELTDIGQAIDSVKRGRGGKALIASVPAFSEMGDAAQGFPEALTTSNTAERNSELIREAQADFMARRRGETPAARTAAICEPLDIVREIPDAFNATEVVSPELPSRPAGRLGFQHTKSIALSVVDAAVALWDETDQANVDPDDSSTWKPCVDVDCPTSTPVTAEAVTACLTFDITTEMSNPEVVRNYMNALDAMRARRKEARVLQRIDALVSGYNFVGQYGALPALVEALNTAISQATYANRQDDPDYTLFLDPLTLALLSIDRANKAYGQEETSDVLAYVRAATPGLSRIVTTLDASASGEPGLPPAAINAPGAAKITLPKTNGMHRIRLIDPRTFIYAETGRRDTGVQTSPDLARQNKAQLFGEEFFFLDTTGPWVNFFIDITLCDDGARAGLTDPAGCSAS